MADFTRIRYENPKLKQSEKSNQLGYSSSTLKRYRNDIKVLSLYRIQLNNKIKQTKEVKNTSFDNNSNHERDLKRAQMSSKDPKTSQLNPN